MLTLAMLAVLAAPVSIEVLGFDVEVKGSAVEVTRVEPESPAGKAGLVVGMQLAKPMNPIFMFARALPWPMSEADLRTVLTPSWGEPLVVRGTLEGKTRLYSMTRTDPEPKERFPQIPMPPEKLKRLSMTETARYYVELNTFMTRRMEAARPKEPALALAEAPIVELNPAGFDENGRVAATPEWLYLEDQLRFHCERSPMRRIEMVGPSPVRKVVALATNSALEGGSVPVELPLWRVKDAQDACRQGRTSLPSVVLVGTLGCEGLPDVSVELSLPLTLRCNGTAPRERYHLDALRVRSAETVLVGDTSPAQLELWWRKLKPTPALVRVVELDARGAVAKRLDLAPPPPKDAEDESTKVSVRLDTSKERVIQLALEVKFPDGSIDVSTAHEVKVVTRERNEADRRAFMAKEAALEDLMKRLAATFPRACEKPDATVAWLRDQPGVDIATNHDGHNLSFSMGGLPMIIDCHLR